MTHPYGEIVLSHKKEQISEDAAGVNPKSSALSEKSALSALSQTQKGPYCVNLLP